MGQTLTEAVLGLAPTRVTGSVQIALTVFVIAYAILVAGAFFGILWFRPYNFYSPSDFGDIDPKTFIEAMRAKLPERVVEQISMVEQVESRPQDRSAQFRLMNSLFDEPERQILILMGEQNVVFPFSDNYWPDYETGRDEKRTWSSGHISGIKFTQRLEGTGLIEISAKGPSIQLTEFGREFTKWLVENGEKASFLKTPLGGWGTPTRPEGLPEGFGRGGILSNTPRHPFLDPSREVPSTLPSQEPHSSNLADDKTA